MRCEADVRAYGASFNVPISEEYLAGMRDQYRYPFLLMHGVEGNGEIVFFIVTFNEAVALIAAGSPDKSGVSGMTAMELIRFFEGREFRDKNGVDAMWTDELKSLIFAMKGPGLLP